MPISVGNNNIRTRLTANNQGMAHRADRRLDQVIDSHAAKFKTALAVDGAVAFIYNKHSGIIGCTCRGFRNLGNVARHELGITGHETPRDDVTFDPVANARHALVAVNYTASPLRQVGSLNPTDLDRFFAGRNVEPIIEKINGDTNDEEGFTEDTELDIVDALFDGETAPVFSGNGDPMVDIIANTNLGNSTDHAFTSNMVACSICYGSGYVDTWRLYNGERIVLDASAAHAIDIDNDVNVDDDTQPVTFSVYERSTIKWSDVVFPTSWRHLIRLAVWNKGEEVPGHLYKMYWTHASNPTVKNVFDYSTLQLFNSSPMLFSSNKLTLYIESMMGPEHPLVLTHVEIIFALGEPTRMQVPEMVVPNEDEFADYNLNATFETSSDVEAKENSYIIEGKYKRVWKVTSINRKLSAQGKSFGYAIDARALHSFERSFVLMNMFRKPLNPFLNNQIQELDDE